MNDKLAGWRDVDEEILDLAENGGGLLNEGRCLVAPAIDPLQEILQVWKQEPSKFGRLGRASDNKLAPASSRVRVRMRKIRISGASWWDRNSSGRTDSWLPITASFSSCRNVHRSNGSLHVRSNGWPPF
jgi:hypothetical protein